MGLVFHGYGQPLAVTILGFCSLTLGVVNARLTIMGLLSYAFFKGAIQCP
jgi:hypothetical protein